MAHLSHSSSLSFVEANVQVSYKFGILHMCDSPWTEMELYENSEESTQYQDFLSLLGRTVSLEVHSGFKGGLDASTVPTSLFSQMVCNFHSGVCMSEDYRVDRDLDRELCQLSVMWHVSTRIPVGRENNMLARKRHIGNDVVVVVFRDYGTSVPFTPSMKSHFNHVFIVVQPALLAEDGSAISYHVQVAAKTGVVPFGPSVPCGLFFRAIPREQLRSFLILKCINGEQASMNAPSFRDRFISMRQSFLSDF